jgi:flagellar protein FliO/FliZ
MTFEDYFRFLLALVFVLGLIGLLAYVARRFNLAPRVTPAKADRRVRIVEILPIDAKRRLVLVSRDGVEHLILLGANNDMMVEGRIGTFPSLSEEAEQ